MPGVKTTSSRLRPGLTRQSLAQARAVRPAYSLVDVLVSLAVIGVLVSLLFPSLAGARETARRVVCSSNMRQHALALAMYADDRRNALPVSSFEAKRGTDGRPQDTMVVRLEQSAQWDGLGVLFQDGYLDAPKVFYCPSHKGDHPFSRYAGAWYNIDGGQIVVNYQYRGNSATSVSGERAAVITDGLRTKSDYSHSVGANVLRSDLSVQWYNDRGGSLLGLLPATDDDISAATKVQSAWDLLDQPGSTSGGNGVD